MEKAGELPRRPLRNLPRLENPVTAWSLLGRSHLEDWDIPS